MSRTRIKQHLCMVSNNRPCTCHHGASIFCFLVSGGKHLALRLSQLSPKMIDWMLKTAWQQFTTKCPSLPSTLSFWPCNVLSGGCGSYNSYSMACPAHCPSSSLTAAFDLKLGLSYLGYTDFALCSSSVWSNSLFWREEVPDPNGALGSCNAWSSIGFIICWVVA